MSRFRQIAVEVAVAEKLGPMLERIFARIIGDDSTSIDDDALHLGALPEFAPPGNVVSIRVFLRDIGLTPAIRPPVPRISRRRAHARSRSDRRCSNKVAPCDRHQKIYFSASWIARFPLLLVTMPNDPLVGLAFAAPQF